MRIGRSSSSKGGNKTFGYIWMAGLIASIVMSLMAIFMQGTPMPLIFTLIIAVIGAIGGWMLVDNTEKTMAILLTIAMLGFVALDMTIIFGLSALAGLGIIGQTLNAIMSGIAVLLLPAGIVVFLRIFTGVFKR